MLATLKAALGEKVSTSLSVLEAHGRDENYPEAHAPLAVVFAESVSDVQTALAWARERHIPIIPFGVGSSLEGHLVPQGPAISLDLSRMNHIVAIRAADFLVTVEPGLTRTALNAALRDRGLFFPVDPGADASLGGMAATNASGTTTVRYGGMRQNVAALEVVLASGEVLHLGRPVRKTSSGYDLKDLFIGSAGTLGVITQLALTLHPVPEYVHTMRVFFPDVVKAAEAAYAVMAGALPVARLELLDVLSIQAINGHLGRRYPERPALFLEFHSSTRESIDAESRTVEALMREAGAGEIDIARTQEERTAQWEARHQLAWAVSHRYPGRTFVITDVAVPLSRMPEIVAYMSELLQELELEGTILGHVGDGNVHGMIAARAEDRARAEAFSARLVRRALELDGTATGEHGIGLAKRSFMAAEHGPAVAWMRQIKALFDPQNILNPGKVV
ncbi:MAG TPA: FAD-binding oxidoreductase [Chloroflexota bacterium]|nr:FAD-binding oxidoreductase [Chloroflexota bacterium]